jgi:hypothetical protein
MSMNSNGGVVKELYTNDGVGCIDAGKVGILGKILTR